MSDHASLSDQMARQAPDQVPDPPSGAAAPVDPVLPTVAAEQFFAVDIRSARVLEVLEFPEARKPAYKLRLDLGPLGERVSSAQITAHYTPENLVGATVVCVVNFPPRRIAGLKSEVLVLGVYDPDGEVILLHPDRPVPPGRRVG